MGVEKVSLTKVQKQSTKIDTKFKPGNGLGGRPKGAKNKLTILREAILQDSEEMMITHFPKIVQAVIARAKEGDLTAAKMIMDRIIPVKKAVEITGKEGGEIGIRIIVEGIQQAIEEDDPEAKVEKVIEGEVIEDTLKKEDS